MTVRRAYMALGSNLGDRVHHLKTGVAGLPDVVAVSPVYETSPVGGPPQGPYLNAVVALDTESSPRRLFEAGQRAERTAGRERRVPNGPRTLDVDVLLVGDLVVDEDDLCVPHARMWARRFVLAPLADLAPDLVAPDVLARAEGEVDLTDIVLVP